MTPDCHPIAAKSRNYSKADQEFIETRISQLLADDIEPSVSPWRAQLVIAQSENRKKRLCGLQPDRKQIHSPGRLPASKHAEYCKQRGKL